MTDDDPTLHAGIPGTPARAAPAGALPGSDDRFERAFHDAPIGIALVAPDGAFLSVNEALCTLLRRPSARLLATDVRSITHPDDLDAERDALREVIEDDSAGYQLEKRYLRPDGSEVWTLLCVSVVRDDAGAPDYLITQLQDITERKRAEEEVRRYTAQLNRLAMTDPLTGLANRRELIVDLDREIERCKRHGGRFSLVLLDLEGFTELNRARGRIAGDDALRAVAGTLLEQCRASDIAARMGADEFAMLLPETSEVAAGVAVKRITGVLAALDKPLRAAFGVASYPAAGTTRELLMIRAEMAVYASRPGAGDEPTEGTGDGMSRLLALARQQLQMKVAYFSEHTQTEQTLTTVEGDAAAFGVAPGTLLPLERTYCGHMLAGRLPNLVADTAAEPLTADSLAAGPAAVRAYVGVPVRAADGRLLGTLCALDTEARPDLTERDVALMHFLAGTVAERIEHDIEASDERRAQSEISGMHALLAALAARDHYTSSHSHDVVALALQVAAGLALAPWEVAVVERVALLHDVGKVGIPDAVLQKRGPLNEEEWQLMRQHPDIGARILEATSSLAHLAPAVRAEHERWDGTGYPDGLAGAEIPIASRIVLACDAYHAMTSDRAYRAAMDPATAQGELRTGAGSQFDPEIVEILLHVLRGEFSPPVERRHPDATPDAVLLGSRQAPEIEHWMPLGEPGRGAITAQVRCACLDCGAHLPGVVSQANLVGSCPNCGSYEIAVVED